MKKMIIVILSVIFTTTLCTACGANASASSSNALDEVKEAAQEVAEEMVSDGTTETAEATEIAEVVEVVDTTEVAEAAEAAEVAEDAAESTETVQSNDVDWHNYLSGNVFDLTGYAEALGYTWIPDPEWEGLAMYCIENGGIKYFLCHQNGSISIYYADENGNNAGAVGGGINAAGEHIYTVTSRGQEDVEISENHLYQLVNILEYLKNSHPVDLYRLPTMPEVTYNVYVCNKASYYPNGMIRQRDFEVIEDYGVKPWDNYSVIRIK